MKILTLLRHAKSSWDDAGLADHDRSLAKRGYHDAPRMGRRLAELGLEPDLLLTSSALRARQTAELVEPKLRNDRLTVAVDPNLYLASPGELLHVLQQTAASIDCLVMVGHNPGLTQLANMLLPTLNLDNLPTAGAVAIECDVENWAQLDAAARKLLFYEYPKKLS